MKSFRMILDILRKTISVRLGIMVFVTLFTCFIPGLWICAVQRLVDAFGEWSSTEGVFREKTEILIVPVLMLGVLFLAKKLDQMFKIPIEMSLKENVGNGLKVQLICKSSRLPLALREGAECQNKMEICNTFIDEIAQKSNRVLLIFRSGIMMISVVGAVFLLDGRIIFALCAGTLPSFLSLVYSMKNVIKTDQSLGAKSRVQHYYAGLMTKAGNAKELKAYALHPVFADRWSKETEDINCERLRVAEKNAVRNVLGSVFLTFGFTAAIILLMSLIMGGSISVGAYAAMFGAITSFGSALNDLTSSVTDVMALFERVKVFREFMDLEEKPVAPGRAVPCDVAEGQSCFLLKNVFFRYPGCTVPALEGVSFEIRKGEHVAVIGENGAGKSTLVKLMLNRYVPETGEILFCGKPVGTYGDEMLRSCEYLPQDFIRYQASLRENVLLHMHDGSVPDRRIIEVLEQVGLSGFLQEIDYDLDLSLGKLFEDGRELSGGQWQRIALARTIIRPSEYIFLDEPTSALDPISEIEVLKTFLKTVEDRTTVIISHRIGVARRCDKILVMEGQGVAEFGTHDELMRHLGPYRKMAELQASLYQ